MKRSSAPWLVEHQCPQCGAPVILRECDRVLSCDYCRVRLFILGENFLRYYIPPSKDIQEELYYVPYWRYRGLYYSCPPYEVTGRFLDTSYLASGHHFLPPSLGVRSQALPLRFVSPQVEGTFLRTTMVFEEAIHEAEDHAVSLERFTGARRVFDKAFIGETVSIIYTPVFIKNRSVYDAVLNRPVAGGAYKADEEFRDTDELVNWNVQFLSTLCPECGWDTIARRDSVALVCGNCVSAWDLSGGSLQRLQVSLSHSREHKLFYVPFWRVEVESSGIDLHSYADFVKATCLPKTVKKEWSEQEMSFWLPAFRANPRLFIRLAKLFTLAQPRIEEDIRRVWPGRESFAPVTLGATEVVSALKATLASISPAKRKLFPLLPDIRVSARRSSLVFLPFLRKGPDLVEANLNLRIPLKTFLDPENQP